MILQKYRKKLKNIGSFFKKDLTNGGQMVYYIDRKREKKGEEDDKEKKN